MYHEEEREKHPGPVLGRLGNYELLERIGAGGMGEVFRARQVGALGFVRPVAVKRLLPHLGHDSAFVTMFIREAKLTARLVHANIVEVYDLGRSDDSLYIAMELVDAANLGELVESCAENHLALPLPVVAHIVSRVAAAVAYAHGLTDGAGQVTPIVHRDISPQNILVAGDGRVKVTDFGIARALDERSTTAPGVIKGKLGYLAPELLEGAGPTPHTDMFALGVVLWECLVGERLHGGAEDLLDYGRMVSRPVPPPSQQRADIPPALDAVVSRALAARPHERFASVEQLGRALVASLGLSTEELETRAREFLIDEVSRARRAAAEVDAPKTPAGTRVSTDAGPGTRLEGTPTKVLPGGSAGAPSRHRALWLGAAIVAGLALSAVVVRFVGEPGSAPDDTVGASSVARSSGASAPVGGPPALADALDARRGAVEGCLSQLDPASAPAQLTIHLAIAPSGELHRLDTEPKMAAVALTECLRQALSSVPFPKSRDGVRLSLPVRLRHVPVVP